MTVPARWKRIIPVFPLLLLSTITYLSWSSSHSFSLEVSSPFEPHSHKGTYNNHNTTSPYSGGWTLPPGYDQLHRTPQEPSTSPPTVLETLKYPSTAPKITIIALWGSREAKRALYLNNFFASVKANPSIDLLLIKFDKYGVGMDCNQPQSVGSPNVREVCLKVDEYWELHVDFLCEKWKCDTAEREAVAKKVRERASGDFVNSYYRPFRAAIFKEWINPGTKIWGWCDLDTMLGNFDRAFPWDIAEDYDLVVPGGPINGDDILLYLPGHLMFFKHSTFVLEEFMTFPNFKTVDAFLNLPWIGISAEESEYSHFAFTNPNLTFLRFDAMTTTPYHISSPGTGIYNIANDAQWDLWTEKPVPSSAESRVVITSVVRDYVRGWKPRPSFTEEGTEYEVKLREGEWPRYTWFPLEYAVDFATDYDKFQFRGRRFIYRRVAGGPIFDRQEDDQIVLFPPSIPSDSFHNRHNRPYLQEMLYNHYQAEKYADWWSLPEEALQPNELLVIGKVKGAQIWDFDSHVHFDTGRKAKALGAGRMKKCHGKYCGRKSASGH
ncbi:hypothetical protein CPB83DRAFT_893901 [Crepidotus variabilis]|uniref:Uncharacterized protein n=1 Tax=Crepidotus variabilis TaxID=179855 RepID=A0A9P6JPW1_9AGAR|nr:hypothetical protein CPB83DRAFT_893901 [Crepidotus variabilis]